MTEPVEWSAEAKRRFQLQSYEPRPRIDGVEIVELTRHIDDGGSITELLRLDGGSPRGLSGITIRQVNYSEAEPGVIKAFHLHTRQTDVWYVPPSDRLLVVLVDVRKGSRTEGVCQRLVLGAGASRLLRLPPGVAPRARHIRDTTGDLLYFLAEDFNTDSPPPRQGPL